MHSKSIDCVRLPAGYHWEQDQSAGTLMLRRLDGSIVAAFSAAEAKPEEVQRVAARDNYQRIDGGNREDTVQEVTHKVCEQVRLRALFFGNFELLCNGALLPLRPNAKAITILKYLIAHRGRPVSQDYLMGWLWPESNLGKARSSLNSAIHILRRRLSGCPLLPSAKNYVLLEDGYYRLCPTLPMSTDVEEFDARYKRGLLLQNEGLMMKVASEYEKAIELYRGDYLVEDLYDDWTLVERERLKNAYIDILSWLAAHYLEIGQPQKSIQVCYQILQRDRCHEESYRQLMRCYARLTSYGQVEHHYRLLCDILKHKYDMEPSLCTRTVFETITKREDRGRQE
jgi:DNA-binding SARP family transcriptional activator